MSSLFIEHSAYKRPFSFTESGLEMSDMGRCIGLGTGLSPTQGKTSPILPELPQWA